MREQEGKARTSELPEFEARLIDTEASAWRKVLGADVEISPLPTQVTTEVADRLKREGFTIVYMPSLDLLPDQFIRVKTTERPFYYIEDYLAELERLYPNWRPPGSLSDTEKADPKVCRNLARNFWEHVRDEQVEFPNLPGRWLAVETLAKPAHRSKYQETLFSKRLGFDDRFDVPWDDAERAIDEAKLKFLSDIGLPRGNLRFLEVLEWNLLGNRFGWGATDTREWTNTNSYMHYGHHPGESTRLVVGSSGGGGAALVLLLPGYSYDHVGFRVALEFGS